MQKSCTPGMHLWGGCAAGMHLVRWQNFAGPSRGGTGRHEALCLPPAMDALRGCREPEGEDRSSDQFASEHARCTVQLNGPAINFVGRGLGRQSQTRRNQCAGPHAGPRRLAARPKSPSRVGPSRQRARPSVASYSVVDTLAAVESGSTDLVTAISTPASNPALPASFLVPPQQAATSFPG